MGLGLGLGLGWVVGGWEGDEGEEEEEKKEEVEVDVQNCLLILTAGVEWAYESTNVVRDRRMITVRWVATIIPPYTDYICDYVLCD